MPDPSSLIADLRDELAKGNVLIICGAGVSAFTTAISPLPLPGTA